MKYGYDRHESEGYLGNIGSLVDRTPWWRRLGRFPVWPYFFLSGLGGVLAGPKGGGGAVGKTNNCRLCLVGARRSGFGGRCPVGLSSRATIRGTTG